jgi:hypothetical protein
MFVFWCKLAIKNESDTQIYDSILTYRYMDLRKLKITD